MTALLLLSLLGLNLAVASPQTASGGAQPSTCPVDDPRARRVVERFLTSDAFADVRQQQGLTGADPASVRVLTDYQDLVVCQKLAGMISLDTRRYPRTAHFYTIQGLYVIPTLRHATDGQIHIGHQPMIVLDADFNLVGSFAM